MKSLLRIPGEWEPHDACWLAFPYLAHEWDGLLPQAERSIAELCRAIAGPGGEPVRLLVKDESVEARARSLLENDSGVTFVRADYGDCWVRDTLPSFGWSDDGSLSALRFRFNGWGAKYDIPFDESIGIRVVDSTGARDVACDLFLEGGALEFNGKGVVITSESCVLNPNRNPGLTRAAFEEILRSLVAVETVVWLGRGLTHDHTDGHVDMLARFATPETVLCMAPDAEAPNAAVLREARNTLRARGFNVLDLPAAPFVRSPRGDPLPSTYCNFYVANRAVVVPTYGSPRDREALDVIASAFPGRSTIGLPARDLLSGGGSFHCTTQPLPALR